MKFKSRKLKCWTCDKVILHYKLPTEPIWECDKCGGLRKIDGTPSLGEMMNLPQGEQK